jgi:hypothetical protein
MPSSVVSAMQYDALTSTLRIIFVSGSIYEYKGVPESVYEDMKAADSKGTYLNRQIKGKYLFKKVT